MSREREDQEPNHTTSSSASDWLDDFLAADLGHGFEGFDWLSAPLTAPEQHDAGSVAAQALPYQSIVSQLGPRPVACCATSSSSAVAPPRDLGQPKKRKSPEHTATPEQRQSSRKPAKKGSTSAKGGAAADVDRDARWAEQLLNPCAAAIEAGNLPRAQHLLFVLRELASFSGDANYRLAAHGLRALALRLPNAVGQAAAASVKMPSFECPPMPTFACVEPRLFRAALIRFHEASPWFALPNALVNAAITAHVATTRGGEPRRRHIHVVDVGVSHGVQWPTLLDALATTRSIGAPRGATPAQPSVRLTVFAGPTATPPAPFSASPPGYDSSPQLIRYAGSVGLDLAIDHAPCLDTLRVHGVNGPVEGEVLVVCVQFRLSYLTADERADMLRKVRHLNPELVFLVELDHASRSDGSMSSEFAARLEMLWTFLESTAEAFKGRDADERRVMEAEAVTALTTMRHGAIVVDGREAWRARMAAAGFKEAAFGGEAVETAKALLRKYDGAWELVPPSPATGAAVGLRWKGQPVSFCSLWRPA